MQVNASDDFKNWRKLTVKRLFAKQAHQILSPVRLPISPLSLFRIFSYLETFFGLRFPNTVASGFY